MPIPYASSSSRPEIRELLEYVAKVLDEKKPLDATREFMVPFDFGTAAARTRELRRRYEEPFRLSFVGEFKAGKSALINAILGYPGLLPEGATPTTGAVTELWWSEANKGEVFDGQGNRLFEGSIEDTVRHADQRTSEGKRVSGLGARVILHLDSDFLRNLVIIDTPGLGANAKDDEATLQSLHLADAAILVLNGLQPGGEDSIILSERLRRTKRKLVGVVTRIDQATPPQEALDAAKKAFGLIIEGEPIGVASPRIQEALKELRSATEDYDAERIEAANQALRAQGYFTLRENLQDSLIGQASQDRVIRTIADLREMLQRLKSGAVDELTAASAMAEKVKVEFDEASRQVHKILQPKIPYLESKVEDIVDKHVSEFIAALEAAVDWFIDDLFEHPIEFGFDSVLANFSKTAEKKLKTKLEARFKEAFPDSQMNITADKIHRAVSRLLQLEWHAIGSQLTAADPSPQFAPDRMVAGVCEHLGELTAAILLELAAFVAFLLVPGGAVIEVVLWIFLNLGVGTYVVKRQSPRIANAKNGAKVRVRSMRQELAHKLSKHYFLVNEEVARSTMAPFRTKMGQNETRRLELLRRDEEWRQGLEAVKRLERDAAGAIAELS